MMGPYYYKFKYKWFFYHCKLCNRLDSRLKKAVCMFQLSSADELCHQFIFKCFSASAAEVLITTNQNIISSLSDIYFVHLCDMILRLTKNIWMGKVTKRRKRWPRRCPGPQRQHVKTDSSSVNCVTWRVPTLTRTWHTCVAWSIRRYACKISFQCAHKRL